MAFAKIKLEKSAAEVENARAKFNLALRSALQKRQDSPSSSDDENNKETTDITIKREPSPSTSTKRPLQRAPRKRRRKDDSMARNSNTFVMKLFDRAVDLSPFSEDNPLYPICRAWINNQPHQKVEPEEPEVVVKEEPTSDIESDLEKICEDQKTFEITQLPPPSTSMRIGNSRDLRIPSPVPPPQEEFAISSEDAASPSKDNLLAKHMQRWKGVRQKWKRAAHTNEDRYSDSGAILKDIYDRSHRESSSNPEQWEGGSHVES